MSENYFNQQYQQRELYRDNEQKRQEPDCIEEKRKARHEPGASRRCPRCGAMVEEGMAFCEECGAQMAACCCPSCHSPLPPGMALCPHCGQPAILTRCSFCGAPKEADELFCPECGNPAKGIVCPICGTLNYRSFCRQCNHPLNERALQAVVDAQNDPRMKEAKRLAEELAAMEELIHRAQAVSAPPSLNGTSEQVTGHDGERLTDADRQLLDSYRSLYAEVGLNYGGNKDGMASTPRQTSSSTRHAQQEQQNLGSVAERQRQILNGVSLKEKMEEFKLKVEQMKAQMNAMLPDPSATPETQRDFICARRVTVEEKAKTVWVCNWCGCQHTQPSDCYREDLGGEWKYEYKYRDIEIIK